MYQYLCAVFIACFITSALAFDASTYANQKVIIEDTYNIYWNVDEVNSVLYLAFQAKTTGWVGFGIGETQSGSMPGADIVVGTIINGVGSITDRHSTAYALPPVDCVQDWQLVAAEESDGWSTFEVRRLLDTGDSQDRPIVAGLTRLICAWGKSDTLAYHSSNRTTSAVAFIGSENLYDVALPDDVQSMDLLQSNFLLPSPNTGTIYICHAFAVPIDRDYHIVRVDPIIDPRNELVVHHFLVHSCLNTPGGYVQTFLNNPGQCFSPLGNATSGCLGLIAGWAEGGGTQYTPPEAGFPMGPRPQSTQYIIIEMHYNDVTKQGGFPDNSGIRIWYTPTIRQYDAAMMQVGDSANTFPSIPPNVTKEYEVECAPECTSTWPTDMHIFGSLLHMHQTGAKIWTTQWRDGVHIDDIGRIEYWAFDHQQNTQVNKIVKPGDRLNLHCVYDTTGLTTKTVFGTATTNEMCMHFLMYYPRIIDPQYGQYSFCGSLTNPANAYTAKTTSYTFCGPQNSPNLLHYTVNPIEKDPPGGANITFGPGNECGESAGAVCQSGNVMFLQTLANSWTSNDQNFSQYQVTLSTSSQPLYSATFEADSHGADFTPWNINLVSGNQYTIPTYQYQNGAIPAYSSYVTFGYIIASNDPASFTLANDACVPPPSCPASVSSSTIEWHTDSALVQQYNLQITNTGSSAIAHANVLLTFSSGSYVSNSWNLAPSTTNPGDASATLACSLWNLGAGQTSSNCGFQLTTPGGLSGSVNIAISFDSAVCV